MQRISLTPREDWQQKVESQGLAYHTPASEGMDRPYWDESVCYEFTAAEVDTLEAAGNELQGMCLAAAQHVIDRKRYAELSIPAAAIPAIELAWEREPPAIYGRFDIAWVGADSGAAPKLLEYNADTPTSLLEADVIQWNWLEDVAKSLPTHSFLPFTAGKADQFNSIHEKLIAKWKDVDGYLSKPVYFASVDEPEDVLTIAYLEDTAQQAGLQTRRIPMLEIGWNRDRQTFVDENENVIVSLFKLYPWETMLNEEFGPHAIASHRSSTPMNWIEPIWKMLLSNKGILPILWELYPGHELLLESYFDSPRNLRSYVRKPMLSREGANVSITYADGTTVETTGDYGDGRYVFQALAPEAKFPDNLRVRATRYPVLGLWMIDQECCGLGIRESAGPITDNLSSFVPHFFR